MRKKVDNRIRILVENGVAHHHRTFFVMVGDRGKDQVINLHYMLSKITIRKPSVLWCYKKDLGFSSHRKKRMKQLKAKIQRGTWDPNVDDPFELFVTSTRIRYCYYKETHLILGQTFGMCILQDFEAVTPNILCRAIETVEGGGIVCILLRSMDSLKQLYNLTMDVHARLSSRVLNEEGELTDVEPRFNERFILSLSDCPQCLVMDDELNILPISRHAKKIVPVHPSLATALSIKSQSKKDEISFSLSSVPEDQELRELKESMKGSAMGALIDLTLTIDQAQVLLSFVDSIVEKSLNSTISLTAGRGRGKSATLGLSIASAIAYSYSNIFITSPSPENVGTLFEFIQKGLVALGYQEHSDFELVQGEITSVKTSAESTEAPPQNSSSKQLVRINVFKNHRQAVQYIAPTDIAFARQAEILVIDEAAAIPLPIVSKLFGPYFVFLSSTINGYEGTGRAMSLKLLQELKQGSRSSSLANRTLKELQLQSPIRYSLNDPIECWLNKLLCLDATVASALTGITIAPPRQCSLYEVNRDSLFSYHKASEGFLQKMISLFVSSHYKNSPNDLMLLSDAPAHHLYVLLPPITEDQSDIPDVYVAIQVAIEGAISKEAIRRALGRGLRPSGDLLPWTLSQSFIDEDFGSLNGARIVRIAVHPSLQRMGYGSEALKQFMRHLEGVADLSLLKETTKDNLEKGEGYRDCVDSKREEDEENLNKKEDTKETKEMEDENNEDDDQEDEDGNSDERNSKKETSQSKLRTELISVRDAPPLLVPCKEKSPALHVDYIGTSFGLTLNLFKFYNRLGFKAVYLRQTPNETTGEHSVIMLKPIKSESQSLVNWIDGFVSDFKNRIVNLLGSSFNHLSINLCLSLITTTSQRPQQSQVENDSTLEKHTNKELPSSSNLPEISCKNIDQFFSSHDLLRLERYSQQLIDRSAINDLLPTISWLLLTNRLNGFSLTTLQTAVLLALGSQRKSVDAIAKEFNVPSNQILALFNKAMHKIHFYFNEILEEGTKNENEEKSLKNDQESQTLKLQRELPEKSFTEELEEGAAIIRESLAERKNQLMKEWSLDKMKQYSLSHFDDEDFARGRNEKKPPISISIKSKRKLPESNPDNSEKDQPQKKKTRKTPKYKK